MSGPRTTILFMKAEKDTNVNFYFRCERYRIKINRLAESEKKGHNDKTS